MRAPVSTYRLQLHAGFNLAAVEAVVAYLDRLGIDWLYLSPILAARSGSTHGYDVVDPTRLNPELGTEQDFERLAQRISAAGRGVLLDIVPNHLAAGPDNPWWLDVLAHGKKSRFARAFDIDWELGNGKVLVPLLGDEMEAVIERQELKLERAEGRLWLRYFEHRLPLCDGSARVPPGDRPALSAPELRALLAEQPYELRYWRAARPLNYRRFFTIGDLVGVRVEDEHVFDWTHDQIASWVRRGLVQGLRVDHPDGLLDPAGYLQRLATASGGVYVVVEKILSGGEQVRPDWKVHGTTGYEQLNCIARLFVDASGEAALSELYRSFTGRTRALKDVVVRSKRLVLESSLAPELDALAQRAHALAARLSRIPDFSAMKAALLETIACFPVYRSYVRPNASEVRDEDRRLIEQALTEAERRAPEAAQAVGCLRSILLLKPPIVHDATSRERAAWVVLRFQQLTGPAAAKGVEDTAFYRFHPLASLAEVGGEPDAFGMTVVDFHTNNAARAARFPHGLSATSTHDTKRSEDVRARISVLSEVPERWAEAVARFAALNRKYKSPHGDTLAPDANDEYLLYQTLFGTFPFDGVPTAAYSARIADYALKAIRESKRHTRWIQPDEAYESATRDFVRALLDADAGREFLERFRALTVPLVRPGLLAALSQLVLKLGSPGAADFYQGTELWDDSLVDPDNRRPVDFEARRRLLGEIERGVAPAELLERIEDGRLKLWVTLRGLHFRRDEPALFTRGSYTPLTPSGARAEQLIGFCRMHEKNAALVACGRFFTRFGASPPVAAAWQDSSFVIPAGFSAGRYEDVLTGAHIQLEPEQRLAASQLFATLPVSLLRKKP